MAAHDQLDHMTPALPINGSDQADLDGEGPGTLATASTGTQASYR
jgi:hypothetical protein